MLREYRIHPAIGIARIGDSRAEGEEGYFIGPEAPGVTPLGSGPYKDATGRIKRQGARFRIYEYTFDDDFTLTELREITANEATIEWQVRLANKKAAAGRFDGGGPRNPGMNADDLTIDPGVQTISGSGQSLEVGEAFLGHAVKLGDLLTDQDGRLIVLGGHGDSFSVPANEPMDSFVDNPGWCDDISDGPVRATIQFDGQRPIPVHDSAWVIVAPPDFAPGITNMVTLWDVVYDVATDIVPLLGVGEHTEVSFTRHIYPILERTVNLQWVSRKTRDVHGDSGRANFLKDDLLEPLADNRQSARSQRERVFNKLANPFDFGGGNMPNLNRGLDPDNPNRRVPPTLTKYQYRLMERWKDGMFAADWPGEPPKFLPFDELPEEERPQAIDRAALESCVGTPFFPGIEAGVIMAQRATYGDKPFRISTLKSAGDLSAGNAVPWQADFVECGLMWWPAQRPVSIFRANESGEADWVPTAVTGPPPVDWRKAHKWMLVHWAQLGFIVQTGDRYEELERDPNLD